jgi:hypothetical protein
MLEDAVMTPVKIDQECQYLTECQCLLVYAWPLADVQQTAMRDRRKGLAELINLATDSKQLVHRGSWECGVDSWQKQPSIR